MNVNQHVSVSLNADEFPEFCTISPTIQSLFTRSLNIGFAGTYPMDCDSSAGSHCPWDKSLSNE